MLIEKAFKYIFFASLILSCISFLNKDRFPSQPEILIQLYSAPKQTETTAAPFKKTVRNRSYDIVPLFDYELYGMVASYHHSSSWEDYYHEKWDDFINSVDMALMWADNIKSGIYKKMSFKSGSWTAYTTLRPGVACSEYAKFKADCFSNNHLLSDDPGICRLIKKAQKGDQIYLKGYLVRYAKSGTSGWRTSSISRNDTSCEIVYLTDFKILKEANSGWRMLFNTFKYITLAVLVAWFAVYYKRMGRPS